MKLLRKDSIRRGRVSSLNYKIWVDPPRRRTVLVNDDPVSLQWPWMIYMVIKKGREFCALVVLCSKTDPTVPASVNGADTDGFDIDKLYCVPDLGHGIDFFGICLGDAPRHDPITAFWNSSFKWKWVPDETQWDWMLFHHTMVTPRKVLDVYAKEDPGRAFVNHVVDQMSYREPRPIPVKGRVMLIGFPTIFYAAAVAFGFTDMWYVTAFLGGLAWWLSGYMSAGCTRAWRYCVGAHRFATEDDEPKFMPYLAGPVGLIASFLHTRGFRYGWR